MTDDLTLNERASIKARIVDSVDDLISDFLYYDRKEDEELPVNAIEESIKRGDITIKEIVAKFEKVITNALET